MKWFVVLGMLALCGCGRDAPPAPDEEQSARLDEAESLLNDMDADTKRAAPEGTALSNFSDTTGAD